MRESFPEQVPLDDGTIDLRVGAVDRAGGRVALTTRELALLRYLAARPEDTVSREQLLVDVWQYAPGVESRTVDTTLKRLRRKLEIDPHAPRHLVSVRGVGYRLVAAEPSDGPGPDAVDLPEDADAFVGRGAELDRVVAAVQSHRQLITLRGPGGVGKSRLAREAARRRSAAGDAVVAVSLSHALSEVYEGAGDRLGQAHHLATSAAVEAEADRVQEAEARLAQALEVAPSGAGRPTPWLALCSAFVAAARARTGRAAEGDAAAIDAVLAAQPPDAFARALRGTLATRWGQTEATGSAPVSGETGPTV